MEVTGFRKELRQKSRDLETLIHPIQAVHQFSNLENVYKVVLDSAIQLENVDLILVYLVDEERREAVLQSHRNVSEDYVERAGRISYPKGVTWKVINSGSTLNLQDIQKDSDIGPAGRDLGQHSALGIPILMDQKAIGVIWFASYKKRKFNEKEVSLLSSFVNQIGLAIAKAKAFEEMKRCKDNLLESEQRYQVLVEHAYDIICEIGVDGRFSYISSKVKDLLGYEPDELVGRSIFEHIHSDDLRDTKVAFIEAASTFSSVNVVFRYQHRNGGWRWLESMGKPYQTTAGDIRGVIASRDITESRLTGEEVLRVSRPESRSKNQVGAPVSLMVATHSTLLRDGIRKMLDSEKDIRIVAEASNNQEIISILEQRKPDVLFVDIGLPGLDVTKTLDLIREKVTETKVLLLLHTPEEEAIINALSLGFSGVLTDVSNAAQFTKAIRAISSDEFWAGRRIIKKALTRLLPLRKTRSSLIKSILTKKEKKIIELVSRGNSNKQIANELFITENTLKSHMVNIFKKLGVSSRYQLVHDSFGEATIKKDPK